MRLFGLCSQSPVLEPVFLQYPFVSKHSLPDHSPVAADGESSLFAVACPLPRVRSANSLTRLLIHRRNGCESKRRLGPLLAKRLRAPLTDLLQSLKSEMHIL